MLQKQSQILPGSGPCPKDEQFLPVQQPGFVLGLQGTSAADLGTALPQPGCGFAPMGKVARYF